MTPETGAGANADADKKQPKFIIWMRDYYDDRNRHIKERVVVEGNMPPGLVRFVTQHPLQIKFTILSPRGPVPQMMQQVLVIQLPAGSVAEAFAMMDVFVAKVAEKGRHDMLKKIKRLGGIVVLPGHGNTPPGTRPGGNNRRKRRR